MRWLINFSFQFVDMSFDVDVVHPMCSILGKVNFDPDKITLRSITVTTEIGRTL